MVLEVIFLNSERLSYVDQRGSEELRDPLHDIGKKHLIDSLVAHGQHLFQPFLGHLHDLLECAVQLHLSQLVRVFDQLSLKSSVT